MVLSPIILPQVEGDPPDVIKLGGKCYSLKPYLTSSNSTNIWGDVQSTWNTCEDCNSSSSSSSSSFSSSSSSFSSSSFSSSSSSFSSSSSSFSSSSSSSSHSAYGNDSYTKLLLPCDGTDGSTSFPDIAIGGGHTVTAFGDAQVDTAQKKFGTGSALFDGSGDYLKILNHIDFTLGSLWGIDCWIRLGATGSYQKFMSTRGLSGNGYEMLITNGNKFGFEGFGTNNTSGIQATTTILSISTWYHLAAMYDGTNLYLFVDGVLEKTYANTKPWETGNDLWISQSEAHGENFTGHLDEIRVVKGVCPIKYSIDPIYISSGNPADGFTPSLQAYS